jgi:predicted nucleic acid-binding protein
MILVDTSVWARHIDREVGALSTLLEADEVSSHPFIVGEIALGNLRRRDAVLSDLRLLQQAAVASHQEVLELVERHKLFGRGIGYVDAHLLAATLLTEDTLLWTLDKKLVAAAARLEVAYQPQL